MIIPLFFYVNKAEMVQIFSLNLSIPLSISTSSSFEVASLIKILEPSCSVHKNGS